MARLFSTTFNYNKKVYTATVTVSNTDNGSIITVNVPDGLPDKQLPGGKLIINEEKKIVKSQSGVDPDPVLVAAILKELEKHETNAPARSVWN